MLDSGEDALPAAAAVSGSCRRRLSRSHSHSLMDYPWQGLVYDPAPLRPEGVFLRQDLASERDRVGQVDKWVGLRNDWTDSSEAVRVAVKRVGIAARWCSNRRAAATTRQHHRTAAIRTHRVRLLSAGHCLSLPDGFQSMRYQRGAFVRRLSPIKYRGPGPSFAAPSPGFANRHCLRDRHPQPMHSVRPARRR